VRRRIFLRELQFLLLPLAASAAAVFIFALLFPAHSGSAVELVCAGLLCGLAAALVRAYGISRVREKRHHLLQNFSLSLRAGDTQVRLPEFAERVGDPVFEDWNRTADALDRRFRELEAIRLQLTTLLNAMQEGVIAIDRAGRVTWANVIVEQIAQQRLPLGAAFVQAVRDPEVLACVQAALEQGAVRRQVSRIIQPGRIYEVTVGPLPEGALAVLHDVTEVERMEATRRDFIANVSHELRTPLTSISGYVETLLDDERLDDEARDFLAIILKNARRMTRLTEDLLALARVESGEHKLNLEPVEANMLLSDAVDALGALVVDHGLILEIAFTTETKVMADRDAMHQVLSNLIENAAKYAPNGERILLGAVDRGETVELFVQDFGPGIRQEHLQRIFERFYRVDKARSVETGGTGLGLAIAKHIMMAHGGSIRVESALNRGATWLMTLPAAPKESEKPANTAF
jgi:two-component system, OmpR family, phosphate regulon sensor histidine kinase PhoR